MGTNIKVNIVEEREYQSFYGKQLGNIIPGTMINPEWKGYQFKITGGSSDIGQPMVQGVLTEGRKKLMLTAGRIGMKTVARKGLRLRKSISGCIIDSTTAVLNMVIVKKGEKDIEGLTDKTAPIFRGPKRASKLVKLLKLSSDVDVRKHVIPRTIVKDGDRKIVKKPKVMRLTTPKKLARKRRAISAAIQKKKDVRKQKEDYVTLLRKLSADKKAQSHTSKSRMSSAVIKI